MSEWLTADCHVPAPGMPNFQTTQSAIGIMAALDPKTTTLLEVADIPVRTTACAQSCH